MSSTNLIYPKEHTHTMCRSGRIVRGCERIDIYTCSDRECGYWAEALSYDPNECELHVISQSTRVTCRECSKCGRRTTDHS